MKTFSALKNNAEFQAARLGLVRGNAKNRGSWYDRKTGEFVAKTVGGSLEFYNKGQQVGKQDRPQTDREKKLSYTCLLYTSPSPRDMRRSRMPSSA